MKLLFLPGCLALALGFATRSEPDYLAYHQSFCTVEALVADEKFEQAETLLDSLLDHYEPRFAKDLVIAAELGVLNNHPEKAVERLIQATRHGARPDCLRDIRLLKTGLREEDWQRVTDQYPASRKTYLSTIDPNLAWEFSRRFNREQEVKGGEGYEETVHDNFNRIRQLTEHGQFPGEPSIGIDDASGSPKLSDCELDNARVIVTLLHYDHPVSELGEPALLGALQRGELHPREFAHVYTFERNKVSVLYRNSRKTSKLTDYCFNFPFGKPCGDVQRVNADRQKFGICSVATDAQLETVCRKYGMQMRFGYR